MRTCDYCGRSIVHKNAQARYCSDKCRTYDRRRRLRNPLPSELTSRDRWVRHDRNKRPLTVDGSAASSTDPATWTSHAEASASTVGVGLGFALGNGIGCIDIDHCVTGERIDPRALELINSTPHFYVEYSPSGEGIHVWQHAEPAPGTRRVENGLNVERYSTGRYITITGEPVPVSALSAPLTV